MTTKKDTHVTISITGNCSMPRINLANRIADFLTQEIGFGYAGVSVEVNSEPYDGFLEDENIEIEWR